ncbi:MAG: pyrroline-5-carboxylate reductase [Planctomycetes bacterium]|nr:pyrroline-5-carboxylate reductase [Planctomycetota bacterium]
MLELLKGRRLGFIGIGKLGEALVSGLIAAGVNRRQIAGADHEADRRALARKELGIAVFKSNAELAKGRDLIVFAVKPHQMDAALADLRDVITERQVVVSVAASVPTSFFEKRLARPAPVIRVMPNTPALLRAGMSVLTRGAHATEHHLALARAVFDAVGKTAVLEERLMDAVTGLSGSGPAYVYVIIESLAEAGVKLGIPRDVATLLAAQTTLGAAQMAVTLGQHPALLKDMVTTPAGCTVDGLMELEEGGLRVTLIKAVVTAARRAKELVNG